MQAPDLTPRFLVISVLLIFLVFFVLSYYVSLRFEFRVMKIITISTIKRCSVRFYLQLFVRGLMSYLRYLCFFAHSGVQHILRCVFLRLVYSRLPVSLDLPFLIAPSVFSNVYITQHA